jgi:hypothetical protein
MKSNFSTTSLLCNSAVFIEDKRGGKYEMLLPILRDKVEN